MFRKFEEENHPAAEVKEEISFQYKMRINLEVTLPREIVIGPFIVNVEPLKQFLVSKRQDLYQRLLEMFATRMRVLVGAVCIVLKIVELHISKIGSREESKLELPLFSGFTIVPCFLLYCIKGVVIAA